MESFATFYRRNLPHWQVDNAPHFLTWRLHDSLPRHLTSEFLCADDYLDTTNTGPHWLRQPRIAQLIIDTLAYAEKQLHQYDLLAWVIMSNHVHIVIHPKAPLHQITKSLKGYTAAKANAILARKGQFWQHESYDRWLRNREELESAIRYVEQNPVKAGLVKTATTYPWSSANSSL